MKKQKRFSVFLRRAALLSALLPAAASADTIYQSSDGNRKFDADAALRTDFYLAQGLTPDPGHWAFGEEIGELYLGFVGQIAPDLKLASTFDVFGVTSLANLNYIGVDDYRVQYESDPSFNIWVGRMLPAVDREGLAGSFGLNSFTFPLLVYYFPGVYQGRFDGMEFWGQEPSGVFHWDVGIFDGRQGAFNPTASPLFTGRLMICLLDPESAYYLPAAYYGKKEVLSLAVSGRYQAYGAGTATGGSAMDVTSTGDYAEGGADLLFEKKLTDDGTASVESAYYHYDTQGAPGAVEGDGYFVLGAYLFGRVQPNVRWERFTPTGGTGTDRLDVGVIYAINGLAERLAVNYGKTFNQQADEVRLGAQVVY